MALGARAAAELELSRTVERMRHRRAAQRRDPSRIRTGYTCWKRWTQQAMVVGRRHAAMFAAWRRHQRLAWTLGRWGVQLERRLALREALSGLLCRRVRRAFLTAWRRWRVGILIDARDRAVDLHQWHLWAHLEVYRRRRVALGVRHILYRMRGRYLRTTLRTWLARVISRRRTSCLVALTARNQSWRRMRRALVCWAGRRVVGAKSRHRDDLHRLALERLRWQAVSEAGHWLRAWRRGLQERQRWARLAALLQRRWGQRLSCHTFVTWSRHARMMRLQGVSIWRAIARMRTREVGACLDHWARKIHQRQRQRYALGRMQHRACARIFNAWMQNMLELRRQRTLCGHVVRRLRDALVASAFEGWCDNMLELRRQRTLCGHVVRRLRDALVASAFEGWYDKSRKQARQRRFCRGLLLRMQSALLGSAFNQWLSTMNATIEARRAAATVDVTVLEDLVSEYEQQKRLWSERLRTVTAELSEMSKTIAQQAAELGALRAKNSKLDGELQQMHKQSTDSSYLNAVCENLITELTDGNQRLRREKGALENVLTAQPILEDDTDDSEAGG
eukprot:COSAG01_NODE_8353_length_2819_cov_2.901471_1_plen_564_part_00